MVRCLKRVPMNFDWPIGAVWHGYVSPDTDYIFRHAHDLRGDPDDMLSKHWKLTDPPEGDGFQMWETTSEGSPQTPVFATVDELAEYCAENCTVFGDIKASAEQWREMLSNNNVHAVEVMPNGVKVIWG